MAADVARSHGDDPDAWLKALLHSFVMEGYERRASPNKLTGDWIVFAKHEGQNYYLDLATHSENDEALYMKLHQGSAAEFPFLFEKPA